jgi:hypothetical protein
MLAVHVIAVSMLAKIDVIVGTVKKMKKNSSQMHHGMELTIMNRHHVLLLKLIQIAIPMKIGFGSYSNNS